MEEILIASVPRGDAPLEVRQAWVGLILPLHEFCRHGPVSMQSTSVLSASNTMFTRIKRRLGLKHPLENWWGYIVFSSEAIHILEASSPKAAQWWRSNLPKFLEPDQTFIFDSECCEPVKPSADQRVP